MSHKQLTNDPREFPAWLRKRAEGHAPEFDITVYARPAVWLALADAIEACALSPPEPTEPRCPFCGRDPFHYVDNGVGMEAVAVICCELGVELYRRTGDTVEMSRDDFVGIANRLRSMPLQQETKP